MAFKPNRLMYNATFCPRMLKKLKPWQLLVAACHFGPKMGDCVQLDYSYTFKDGVVCCEGILLEEVDVEDPMEALEDLAGFDWKEWAIEKLEKESEKN